MIATSHSEIVWVRAPHYTAGLVITSRFPPGNSDDYVCTEAAPILRWALGKPWEQLRRYFQGKRFEVVVMPDPRVK